MTTPDLPATQKSLELLSAELDRRAGVVADGGEPGPPIVIYLDEADALMEQIRNGLPLTGPALRAMEKIAYAGRSMRIYIRVSN